MTKALLFLMILLCVTEMKAQQRFAGVVYKPYLYDIGGSDSRWKNSFGLKNMKLTYQQLISDHLVLAVDFNKGVFKTQQFNYQISADVLGLSIGRYTRNVFRKIHFNGFLAGIRAGRVVYSMKPEFNDPLGTTYSESYQKIRWEAAATLHYFYYLPVAKHFYITGSTGMILSPQNVTNPLDRTYHLFDWPPFFSPVAGAAPLINMEFNIGMSYCFETNTQ